MTHWRMTRVHYTSDLWQDRAVQPALWDLLLRKDLLLEISAGPPPYRVLLGVPHHAAPGAERIAEDWKNDRTGQFGRAADESTGLTGLAFFQALRDAGVAAKLVIACHATDHDPNKTPGAPYWASVFSEVQDGTAPLLFELHGAANHRNHGLELSAGKNKVIDPALFGRALSYFYTGPEILAYQLRPGSSEARLIRNGLAVNGHLQNPALGTQSLIHAGELGIPALHLEMKTVFRAPAQDEPDGAVPSPQAWRLARAAASAIRMFDQPDDVHITAAELGLPSTAFLTRPALEYQASYMTAVRETPLDEMNDNPELRVATPDEFTNLVMGTRSVDYYGLPEHPPEEFLWLVDRGEFIGRAYFLHWLNGFRLQTDGQVDYWIRPSRRRQGYGWLLLHLLLERYRQFGLRRVLVTCLETNLASQKVILANGGRLERRIETPDWAGVLRPRLCYWIDLPRE